MQFIRQANATLPFNALLANLGTIAKSMSLSNYSVSKQQVSATDLNVDNECFSKVSLEAVKDCKRLISEDKSNAEI